MSQSYQITPMSCSGWVGLGVTKWDQKEGRCLLSARCLFSLLGYANVASQCWHFCVGAGLASLAGLEEEEEVLGSGRGGGTKGQSGTVVGTGSAASICWDMGGRGCCRGGGGDEEEGGGGGVAAGQ